ncbi:MAG TPA: isochorismatase family cysteine hydrolase [Mucilaginibacter sp.]|nr:isochorismatase family cysteine hydrolase [Mucilaginibacter sp.]
MRKNTNHASVLLVMDIQRNTMEFLPDPIPLLRNIQKAISAARKASIPVIYVVVSFRNDYPEISPDNKIFYQIKQSGGFLLETAEGTGIHLAVAPKPGDIIIKKKRISAFAGSDLEIVLRSFKTEQLIITGFATSGVVLSTVREAADKDYLQTVLSDCCEDLDEEVHKLVLTKILNKQATILTVKEWSDSLNRSNPAE